MEKIITPEQIKELGFTLKWQDIFEIKENHSELLIEFREAVKTWAVYQINGNRVSIYIGNIEQLKNLIKGIFNK